MAMFASWRCYKVVSYFTHRDILLEHPKECVVPPKFIRMFFKMTGDEIHVGEYILRLFFLFTLFAVIPIYFLLFFILDYSFFDEHCIIGVYNIVIANCILATVFFYVEYFRYRRKERKNSVIREKTIVKENAIFTIIRYERKHKQISKRIEQNAEMVRKLNKYKRYKFNGEYCVHQKDMHTIISIISQNPNAEYNFVKLGGKSILNVYICHIEGPVFSATITKR